MKPKLLVISLIFVLVTTLATLITEEPDDQHKNLSDRNINSDQPGQIYQTENPNQLNQLNQPNQNTSIDSKQLDGNNISTWYRNNGNFNRNPNTDNSGFEWPKGSNKHARYASGLWIGAIVGNDTLVAIAEYSYEYLPGYIDNNGNPQGKDDPAYKVYKIVKGDSVSSDYQNWPVNQGAYTDSRGKPLLIGDQTIFTSFTDGYPEAHGNRAGSTSPLKAVILQTSWCFNKISSTLDNVVFTEYRIINKSNVTWTNCFIGNWTDDDLGTATNDANGCDSVLNLGYIYNINNSDGVYGSAPPAVGFINLIGGIIQSQGDTAKYYSPPGSNNLIIKPNYKNLFTSSILTIYKHSADFGQPENSNQTYTILEGKSKSSQYFTNPATGNISSYPFSGNPETGSGWLMNTGDDRQFIISSGPFTVNPGDTQRIVTAQIISKGDNNLNSVTKLKNDAGIVKNFFVNNMDFNVVNPPSPVVSTYAPGNGKIYLSWNDTCEKVSFKNYLSGGEYKFQGYNIYQIRPNIGYANSEDTILLKTFDKTDGILDILDSVYLNEYEGIVYGIVQKGSDNGISRYIVIEKDTLTGWPFINGSEYKFAVTAYYYDPKGGLQTQPKVNSTKPSSNIVKVIPQSLTPGTQLSYKFGDTILTSQRDLAVMPVVFEPFKLVSANYQSTFGLTDSALSYTLTKTVNNNTSILLQNIKDFSGVQDSAKTIDGFLLVHQMIRDSGVVPDLYGYVPVFTSFQYEYFMNNKSLQQGWTYEPAGNQWCEGPDTTAVLTAKVIAGRQFQNRSIGMSFPTTGVFRNSKSRIFANGKFFKPQAANSPILTGGPLRKIQIVFGQSSMSYRFLPADTNLSSTPCADMVSVPFSVFAIDELDSGGGVPRQLNTGFLDKDSNGVWDPDTSLLGNYHFTYILASNYDPNPNPNYLNKNPGITSPTSGLNAMDVMYAWLPRVKKSPNGIPLSYTNDDRLTIYPYRVTRADFVPGYPLKYNWSVQGTSVNSSSVTANNINSIKAFPNPYYGYSTLEYDAGGEKFIYFSNLPLQCNIYIYSLNGSLVNTIVRNVNDPGDSLEKWNLKNSGGSDVASGMYIVFVDCKNLGAKTLKIAVFTSK